MLIAAVVLALALTWLLIRSLQPSDSEYMQVQQALVGISTAEVSLESDLLSLRGGLLHDYDPIVADIARLRLCLARLRTASNGAAAGPIAQIADAIEAQESLAETFKSANALAQNSFAYFALLSDRLARTEGASDLAARTGALTAAVLQLSRQPTAEAIAETNQRLANVGSGTDAALAPDVASLVLHGRLLVDLLPTIDSAARRLPALLTPQQRGEVRAVFEQRQKGREHLAGEYRFALYAVAILFLGSLVELGRRLRNGALALQELARTEHLLAEVSNTFIGCQPEDIRLKIRETLMIFGIRTQSVRTYVFLLGADPDLLIWTRPDVVSPPEWPGALAKIVPTLAAERNNVLSTADFGGTPPPNVQALLRRYGIPRWSCVKLFDQDEFMGILVFERAPEIPGWRNDMTPPLQLAGITMSNALHRERLARHRLALEEKVQRAKRLETVGLFASGIAHNFNNLLGVMLGHAEMVADQPAPPALVRQHAQHITEAGERAGALVQGILNYGRRNDGVLRPVAMGTLIPETVSLLAPSLPVRIDSDIRIPDGGACVAADPTQIQQVLVNLIRNAAQASENGTPVMISAETSNLARRRKLSHGTLEPGSFVRISVSDDGIGIPADVQRKLFQPFFTTRPAGTGLGLATAAEVVRDLGGAFQLDSIPGQGTTFALWLPVVRTCGPEGASPVGHGEVIMVAAWQTSRVKQAEDTLAALGYEPVGLTNAGSALSALRADPERFDLILIADDLVDMSAADLAQALRAIDARVPLVFLRLGTDGDGPGSRGMLPFDDVLTCPPSPADLATLMTRLVRRRAPARAGTDPTS